LGEARQIVGSLLAIVHHLVDFLRSRIDQRLTGCATGILLRHQFSNTIRLLLLASGQLLRGLSHRIYAAGGVLLLQATEQIRGLA